MINYIKAQLQIMNNYLEYVSLLNHCVSQEFTFNKNDKIIVQEVCKFRKQVRNGHETSNKSHDIMKTIINVPSSYISITWSDAFYRKQSLSKCKWHTSVFLRKHSWRAFL